MMYGEDNISKGDTESAEESNADNDFARKKRAYDSVSGDDAPQEPPTKKRAPEEVAPDTEPMETEADKNSHEEDTQEDESAGDEPSTDLKATRYPMRTRRLLTSSRQIESENATKSNLHQRVHEPQPSLRCTSLHKKKRLNQKQMNLKQFHRLMTL